MIHRNIKDTYGDELHVSVGGGKVWLQTLHVDIVELDAKGISQLKALLEKA